MNEEKLVLELPDKPEEEIPPPPKKRITLREAEAGSGSQNQTTEKRRLMDLHIYSALSGSAKSKEEPPSPDEESH